MPGAMLAVEDVAEAERARGESVEVLAGDSYKNASIVVVVPTRGNISHRVVAAWDSLLFPPNQRRQKLYAAGEEVGVAYEKLVAHILEHPVLSSYTYILTLEDDNLPPPDAVLRLLQSINFGPFDAVGGLYFTKGMLGMPMAYGDPEEFSRTGVLDFRPRTVAGVTGNLMEVNGVAMGCTLWRTELFRQVKSPWFVTVCDVFPEEKCSKVYTQDLRFCEVARRAGKRFAVDLRVRVGHIDVETGVVY